MENYLKEFCANQNIVVIFTEDDYIALSSAIKDGTPIINAHRIFEDCPEKVAKAVLSYYTEPQYDESLLKIIRGYIDSIIVTVAYIIKPPDKTFKSLLIKYTENLKQIESIKQTESIKHTASKAAPKEKKQPGVKQAKTKPKSNKKPKDSVLKGNTSSLVELNISSITKKNFYGGSSNIKEGETIKAAIDDVVEIDIEVDDSK